jgi:hypothetical protein
LILIKKETPFFIVWRKADSAIEIFAFDCRTAKLFTGDWGSFLRAMHAERERKRKIVYTKEFLLAGALPPNPWDFGAWGRYIDGKEGDCFHEDSEKNIECRRVGTPEELESRLSR